MEKDRGFNGKHIGHLIMCTARQLAGRTDRALEKVRLYRGQGRVLLILSERDGLAHSEIARELEISPAAATKVIKRLEALHYLERRPDPGDERVSRVYLREEGRSAIRVIREVFQQNNAALCEGLSAKELAELEKLLRKLQKNLQKPDSEKV